MIQTVFALPNVPPTGLNVTFRNSHLELPARRVDQPFPVYLRSDVAPANTVLVPFEGAQNGDLTGFSATYSPVPNVRDTFEDRLGAAYFVGPDGHEVQECQSMRGYLRYRATQLFREEALPANVVANRALDWILIASLSEFQIKVFTFAQVRIWIDAESLLQPLQSWDFACAKYQLSRPCVIEVFGRHSRRNTKMIASRHLEYLSALLPVDVRFSPGEWQYIDWGSVVRNPDSDEACF